MIQYETFQLVTSDDEGQSDYRFPAWNLEDAERRVRERFTEFSARERDIQWAYTVCQGAEMLTIGVVEASSQGELTFRELTAQEREKAPEILEGLQGDMDVTERAQALYWLENELDINQRTQMYDSPDGTPLPHPTMGIRE